MPHQVGFIVWIELLVGAVLKIFVMRRGFFSAIGESGLKGW